MSLQKATLASKLPSDRSRRSHNTASGIPPRKPPDCLVRLGGTRQEGLGLVSKLLPGCMFCNMAFKFWCELPVVLITVLRQIRRLPGPMQDPLQSSLQRQQVRFAGDVQAVHGASHHSRLKDLQATAVKSGLLFHSPKAKLRFSGAIIVPCQFTHCALLADGSVTKQLPSQLKLKAPQPTTCLHLKFLFAGS